MATTPQIPDSMDPHNGWAPLRVAHFRNLWIAALASNAGSWMQNVAAAWLMVTLTPSPLLASLVQTANTFPTFLLALPAGALADSMDRRRLLLFTQSWMLVAAALLGIATLAGFTGPGTLLAFTFLLGLGAALNQPAWAAAIPELVPPEQLASAVTLNSIQFNVARAIGPALAGLVLAAAGPASAFLLNALSFVAVLIAIAGWQETRPSQSSSASGELLRGIREGLHYVRHDQEMRQILARLAWFATSSSALWALLPVYARHQVHATEPQFGLMMSSLGTGAVAAGLLLSRTRHRWQSTHLVAAGTVTFAVATYFLRSLHSIPATYCWLLPAGFAWITVMSSLNVAAQSALPSQFRARGLSVYILVFQGAMATGSWLWGNIADRLSLGAAFTAAAATLLLSTIPLFVTSRYQKNR